MIIKRKLYSSLEEKVFGEVKRVNKAAKRAEMIEKSGRKIKETGDIDRMVKSGRKRNLRWQENDLLVPGRSKVDRLNNLSYESKNKIFDKRREALGRTGDGFNARYSTKHNLPNRPGTKTGDILANKGTKAERLARLSEKNQIRYHRNNANRGQEMIKLGESTSKVEMPKTNTAPITTTNTTTKITSTNTTPITTTNTTKITSTNTAPKTTTTSTSFSSNKATDTVRRAQSTTTSPISQQTKITPKNSGSIFNNSLNPMKWSKNAKIGAGIAAGTVVLGTGAYFAKKHHDKKKDKKD